MRYWLMKSEADVYSIDDLERDRTTSWEGIRNYLARNHMREMRIGDRSLFYHSNAQPSGVVGIAEVVGEARPDPFAFEPGHRYHDPRSDPGRPRWDLVEIGFVERFPRMIPLSEFRAHPEFEGMQLLTQSRLSVQSVTPEEWDAVLRLAHGGA